MAQNAALVRAGISGAAFVGSVGATYPTGLAVPGTGFEDVGAISDEGLLEARSEERTVKTPWGSTSPIRTLLTSAEKTFQITCWETNPTVLSLFYQVPIADMTEATGVVSFNDPAIPERDLRAWVFDVFDGDVQHRFEVPLAEITNRADVSHNQGDVTAYQFTITALPGSDGVAIRHKINLDLGTP